MKFRFMQAVESNPWHAVVHNPIAAETPLSPNDVALKQRGRPMFVNLNIPLEG